jgi:hypothetical protein
LSSASRCASDRGLNDNTALREHTVVSEARSTGVTTVGGICRSTPPTAPYTSFCTCSALATAIKFSAVSPNPCKWHNIIKIMEDPCCRQQDCTKKYKVMFQNFNCINLDFYLQQHNKQIFYLQKKATAKCLRNSQTNKINTQITILLWAS